MAIDTLRNSSVEGDHRAPMVGTRNLGTTAIWIWTFAISTLAVWSSSLVMYSAGAGAEFARITPLAFLVLGLSMTAAIGIALAATWAIGKLLRAGRAFGMAVFWFACYLSLSGTIFPLPRGVGMTSLADYGTSWVNLALGVTLATAATLLLKTRARMVPLAALVAVSISTVTPLAYGLLKERGVASGAPFSLSGRNDILVLGFDGIQHDVFIKAIRDHPQIVSRLKNFRFFDNVIASSPATHASLTGILVGNRDFKAEARTTEDLIALARAKGIPGPLAQSGYRVSGYGPFSHVMLPQYDITPSLARGDPVSELAYLLQVSASLHLGPQIASSPPFERRARSVARRLPVERPSYEHSISQQIDRGHGPAWDRSLLRSWDDFTTYRDKLQVRENTPAAHFLHFSFTHHPVDFDMTCSFRSEDKDWYDASQSYEGLLGEAVCAVRSMEALLARLDEIGAFEDNLIVIMSDHGAPVQWNDPDSIEGRKIRDNPDWGYGRYLPVLMVKLPGERRDAMEHDGRPAILDDLAASICLWAQIEGCVNYQGMNLFDPNSEPTDGYFINIVTGPKANFRFETHETIRLDRSKAPLQKLHDYLSANTPH